MHEMLHGTCCRMDFELPTSLHAMNRMFNFAAFFIAYATLCVIRYDHLAMKHGRDVEELKFSHRLWTLISDARICKQCSVNRTSFHIPNFNGAPAC